MTEISGTVQSSSATSQIQPATTQGGKGEQQIKLSGLAGFGVWFMAIAEYKMILFVAHSYDSKLR